MSTESLATPKDNPKEQTPKCEKPKQKPPIPDLLRHQHSFEQRYSGIIQKQIWETSINKEVLERQLNAYFPFARSASLQRDGQNGLDDIMGTTTNINFTKTGITKSKSAEYQTEEQKILERLETIDIADKCQTQTQTQATEDIQASDTNYSSIGENHDIDHSIY